MRRILLPLVAAAALFAPARAQLVGSPLPPDRLVDWQGTEARALSAWQGRTLLIAFFSYW